MVKQIVCVGQEVCESAKLKDFKETILSQYEFYPAGRADQNKKLRSRILFSIAPFVCLFCLKIYKLAFVSDGYQDSSFVT